MDYPVRTLSQLRPILQGFRKAAGLTQAGMASRLGVTQQTYAQLEANPAAVSVERLFKVLRVLNVDLTMAYTATRAAQTGSAAKPAATIRAAKTAAGGTATSAKKTPQAASQRTTQRTTQRATPGTTQRATKRTGKQQDAKAAQTRVSSPAKRTTTAKVSAAGKNQTTNRKATSVSKKRENW